MNIQWVKRQWYEAWFIIWQKLPTLKNLLISHKVLAIQTVKLRMIIFHYAPFANHIHPSTMLLNHWLWEHHPEEGLPLELYNRTLVTPTLPSGAVAPLDFSSHLEPALGQLCWAGWAGPGASPVLACESRHGRRESSRDRSYWIQIRLGAFWSKIAVLRGKTEKAERMQIWVGRDVSKNVENQTECGHWGDKRRDKFRASILQIWRMPHIFMFRR